MTKDARPTPPSRSTIHAVGAVIYRRDDEGQPFVVLIRKRNGFWTLPKGKRERDESDRRALKREVAEETGLAGDVGEVVRTVAYSIVKRGRPVLKQVTYYLVYATNTRLRPSRAERIDQIGWFPAQTALRRIRRGRVRVVLRSAIAMLDAQRK